jgi:protein O-mannosyl-transferase
MTDRNRSKRSRRRSPTAATAAPGAQRATSATARGESAARPSARHAPLSAHRQSRWWYWPLLALAVVAAYAPVLKADLVNWDDQVNVYENPRVVETHGVLRTWSTAENPEYLPLTYTTFWLEWRLAGESPWVFHLDNVLLHAGNAALAGALAHQLGLAPTASLLVAALWALHPMQVASVAWVTERKNVLYVFFWLASLLLYLRASAAPAAAASTDQSARSSVPRSGTFALSVALFAAALLSKRAAITLPAAIVLVEWARGRDLDRRFWLSWAPYAIVGMVGALAVLHRVPAEVAGPPLLMRLGIACRALWFYVATFIWPSGLLPVYPRWPLAVGAREQVAVVGTLAAVAFGVALRRRLSRTFILGVGLFLINAALVIGIVWFTFFRFSLVSDHLAYLPSLGLALAAMAALLGGARVVRLPERAPLIGAALACAALAATTWHQIAVWHDSQTLWASTLARNPDCIPCHINLAMLRLNQGKPDDAIAHYERALEIEPAAKTMVLLGNVLMRQDHPAKAQALYERSLRVDASDPDVHYNLGNALRVQGKTEEAIARYREGLRLDPRSVELHHNLGLALLAAKRLDEAAAELEEALRLSPGDVDAEFNLGVVADERGDLEQAIARYTQVLRQESADDPKFAVAHKRLAQTLLQAGRTDEALAHLEAAHRIDPDDADDLRALAADCLVRHSPEQAVQVLERARARTPDAPELLGLLAWIRATSTDARWRDGAQAVQLAERASALTHDEDADLLDTLAAAYAEAGRFDEAAQAGRRALRASDEDPEFVEEVRKRIALYEMGKPFRQP